MVKKFDFVLFDTPSSSRRLVASTKLMQLLCHGRLMVGIPA